jgi:(S)-citramalyl-CoA lyase
MTVVQSMLFVPGARPDRFAKALDSGADCVCIDLEDSVPADGKSAARAAALGALGDPRLAIRLNALSTRDGLADLLAVAEAPVKPRLLFLPKVEAAAEIAIARSAISDETAGFVPLIETVKGLDAAGAIAMEPGVAMVMFGGADFAAELGVALAWEPLLHARSRLVMACAGAGVPALDVPFIALDDRDGLHEECARAKALGFAGKAAIHPAQVAVIHDVFRPTAEQVAEAEEAEAAFAAAGGAAVRFKGRMLEAPVMQRYRQILALKEKIDA